MKFWQSLVFVEIDQVIALAQFCEELGFYGVVWLIYLPKTACMAGIRQTVSMNLPVGR